MKDTVLWRTTSVVTDSRNVAVSFGADKSDDAVDAVEYVTGSRRVDPLTVAVVASSMETVATILSIGELSGVGAAVLDSTPTNFKDQMEYALGVENGLPTFLFPGIFAMTDWIYSVDFTELKPIDYIDSDPDRAVLFFHGSEDPLIPPSNPEELLEKINATGTSDSRLVVFDGAEHVETFRTDPDLYVGELLNFIRDEGVCNSNCTGDGVTTGEVQLQ